ncbi:protein DUF642 L-GALACTONO-1,4-LACTONE-RESPONSIVE GENE 2-like [Carex rostrata]
MQTVYSSSGWGSYVSAFPAKFVTVDLVIHNTGVEEDPGCGPLIDSAAFQNLYLPRMAKISQFFAIFNSTKPISAHATRLRTRLTSNDYWYGATVPRLFIWKELHGELSVPVTTTGTVPRLLQYHTSRHGTHSKQQFQQMSDGLRIPFCQQGHGPFGGRETCGFSQMKPNRQHYWRERQGSWENILLTLLVCDAANGCVGPMAVEAFAARGTVKVVLRFKMVVLRFMPEIELS